MIEHGERETFPIGKEDTRGPLMVNAMMMKAGQTSWNAKKKSSFVSWAMARLHLTVSPFSLCPELD